MALVTHRAFVINERTVARGCVLFDDDAAEVEKNPLLFKLCSRVPDSEFRHLRPALKVVRPSRKS